MYRGQSNTRGRGRGRGKPGGRAQVNAYYPPLTESHKLKAVNNQLLKEGYSSSHKSDSSSSHKSDDKDDDGYTVVRSKKSIKEALIAKPKLNFTELHTLLAYSSIMTLDYEYVNWMTDPYYIAGRFMTLDNAFLYSGNKDREYYENILVETDSVKFQRFFNFNSDHKDPQYSKALILRVISAKDWGLNLTIPRTLRKTPYTEYNYFDYIDAWNNAFLYEAINLKHTWFFQFTETCMELPNWFYDWWETHGAIERIYPEKMKKLFDLYIYKSPSLKDNDIAAKPIINFSLEFFVPWIWSWTLACDFNHNGHPRLIREYHVRYWNNYPTDSKCQIIEECLKDMDKEEDKSSMDKASTSKDKASTSIVPSTSINTVTNLNPVEVLKELIKKEKPHLNTEQLKAAVMEEFRLQVMSTFGMGKTEKMDLINTPTVAIKGKGKDKVEEENGKTPSPIASDEDFMDSQGYTPLKGDISINEDLLNDNMEINLNDDSDGNVLYNLLYRK